ncbi:MAG: 30S ribosomal protein S12 methylthiotransferase RimO, partial [Victivallales bacterium]|nr:30S ribosomal protein S12 methylthiotransferase RimO [Victivallales bacterium]
VAGCLAQRELPTLKQKYPQVDIYMGLDDVPRIAELLKQAAPQEEPQQFSLPKYLYDHDTPRLMLTPSAYAYIKVAEGCDHRCAYCAIPMIRGAQRSRDLASVEAEAKQLLQGGSLELDFIAQDTSRYGVDLQPKQSLEALLRRCDAIDGDFWLRVLYTHPLHLTEGLVDVLANSKHVVPYLDIPLQHIATNVLRRMNRAMDGDKVRELLAGIRAKRPDMTIRTTFLVGFPGETEEDFQELLDYVKTFRFDRLGVFVFSPEAGTPAYEMKEGIVPEEVARERAEQIMLAQREISLAKNRSLIGTKAKVLLEELVSDSKRGQLWHGRTAGDAPEVDQTVTVKCKAKHNGPCFVEANVTAAKHYELEAEEIAR